MFTEHDQHELRDALWQHLEDRNLISGLDFRMQFFEDASEEIYHDNNETDNKFLLDVISEVHVFLQSKWPTWIIWFCEGKLLVTKDGIFQTDDYYKSDKSIMGDELVNYLESLSLSFRDEEGNDRN